jgi:hypothetical protein
MDRAAMHTFSNCIPDFSPFLNLELKMTWSSASLRVRNRGGGIDNIEMTRRELHFAAQIFR